MALRLKPSYETEVYVTEGGYVAIKQPDAMDPEQDAVVLLSAHQLEDVISELQALLNDRASWEFADVSETDEHDAKPPEDAPTAARSVSS